LAQSRETGNPESNFTEVEKISRDFGRRLELRQIFDYIIIKISQT
jgi:hypothetical protein